jgi:hypothetical protein
VQAVKIGWIRQEDRLIVPACPRFDPFHVEAAWLAKHQPEIGGYVVLYEDGYMSFSPAEGFEGGYERM